MLLWVEGMKAFVAHKMRSSDRVLETSGGLVPVRQVIAVARPVVIRQASVVIRQSSNDEGTTMQRRSDRLMNDE